MNLKNHRILHVLGLSRVALKKWLRRSLFLAGGLCVGGAAVLMAILADRAQSLFRALYDLWPIAAFVLTPLGFALAALLALTVFPNSQGSGIPQVIAARQLADEADRVKLVSLRIAGGKIVTMMIGLLCGASIGREGPTVQVGAAIMHAIGRRVPANYHQGLLLAGASAGIAAAFNTPLAGIVFGIEELSRSFEVRTSGLVIACVIAAGITSLAIMGDYTYFGTTAAVLPLGRGWLIVPLCGLFGGLGGGAFSRILVLFSNGLPGRVGGLIKRNPVVFAGICGLGVALCGWVSAGAVYGTGYGEARAILHETATTTTAFGPWKFLATTLSAISGIPGGIFAPSLAVGAGLGELVHGLFQSMPIAAVTLLGMVAYLAGVVQTPITSFVIVSEMTQDHAMIIPLMVAAVIATAVSRFICPQGLYHSLAQPYLRASAGPMLKHEPLDPL